MPLSTYCQFFLNNLNVEGGGRNRPHLNVVVDLNDFVSTGAGSVLEGTTIDGSAIRRLLFDAGIHRVVTSGRSTILDYGATTQAIPAPLWAALVIRDRHCRFPGCDRRPQWCEGHHIHHYADGGSTDLSNLVMLCSRHHHLLHRAGWAARLDAEAELVVRTPYGRVLTSWLANAPPLPIARSA